MPDNRFYIPLKLEKGTTVTLAEEEARHLFVMRTQLGENLELVNGQGQLAHSKLLRLTKKEAQVEIENVITQKKSPFELILAQAIPRVNRLDAILEKGTELGATAFWLFPGLQSEKIHLSEHQLARMEKILISALKQCGRLYLPQIQLRPNLLEWQKPNYPIYFGDLRESAPSFQKAWETAPPKEGAIFVVGPEKGFSQSETHYLEKLGAHGVKLHTNILRTDTAPLSALSLISHFMLASCA